jgi:hypothetical protein
MSQDRGAGEALLRTGVIVPVRILEESVMSGANEAEFALRLTLSFEDEDSPEEDRADVVEWGALGFLFAIGVLSLADARPRGPSEIEYIESDDFRPRCGSAGRAQVPERRAAPRHRLQALTAQLLGF